MPLSDSSSVPQDAKDTPIWSRNPFAPESDQKTLHLGTGLVRENPHDYTNDIWDSPVHLEYNAKPRPAPIYQDKQHEEYWTFLKSVPDIVKDVPPPPSRCPSLLSGSTMSSRNSSTRSTRSSIWDPIEERKHGIRASCLEPDCDGLCLKDVNTHARIAHSTEEPPEMCPVKECEYYLTGFTRAGDRKRHTLTHFKGALTCGFCKSDAVSFTQASDRVHLFLTHLIKEHGVRGQRLDSESGKSIRSNQKSSDNGPVATCSVCSEPFRAQGFYEHLPGCISREVNRNEDADSWKDSENWSNHRQPANKGKDVNDAATDAVHTQVWPSSDTSSPVTSTNYQPIPVQVTIELTELVSEEMAELTASSRCLSLTSSKAVESSEEETDWTEEVTSRESSPGIAFQLPRRLSPAKRRVVETIMQEFQRLFRQSLRTHTTGGSSSSSSHGGHSGWSSNASTYSSASFVSRKRSLSGGGSTPPNDEDDSNKRRRPDSKVDGKQPMAELRFACPYYKRNPGRHQTFTSCRDPGFTTVARLKEHLYRRHLLPPQCHRCCTTFPNDAALREHQRDARGCEVREQIPLEGFDKDQERRLKSKKRSQVYQSEEDKWKGVYRILFPDDGEADMPGPFVEYQPCNGEAAEPSNIVRFQEFSRLELPRLVRRTLEAVVEQEAQPLEDKLKERLVDIVKECQTQLVSMFQAATGSSAEFFVPTTLSTTMMKAREEVPAGAIDGFAPLVFEDFDSLPVRTIEPTPSSLKNNTQSSGSPDSGYDSAWPSTSLPPHSDVGMDLAFAQTNPNELIDLGGYYGLFEDRTNLVVPTVNTNTGLGWPFLDPLLGMASVEAMGLSSLHKLDSQWEL